MTRWWTVRINRIEPGHSWREEFQVEASNFAGAVDKANAQVVERYGGEPDECGRQLVGITMVS